MKYMKCMHLAFSPFKAVTRCGIFVLWMGHQTRKVDGGRNWETPEGIDWKSLRSHLQTALETFSQAETVPRPSTRIDPFDVALASFGPEVPDELNLGPNDENVIQKGQASYKFSKHPFPSLTLSDAVCHSPAAFQIVLERLVGPWMEAPW